MHGQHLGGSWQWHRFRVDVVRWLVGVVFIAGIGVAYAQPSYSDIPGCTEGALPSNDPRYPAAQLIVTCAPTQSAPVQWNGVLIVVVHGYVEPQQPLTLPTPDMNGLSTVRVLMNLGFAVATSSFHKNGYAVEQGGSDINALVRHFNSTVAPARHVLLFGGSEGGLITAMLIERNPELYAGGLALCGPLGGANVEVDYLTDFRAVFDYFFPEVFDFGAVGVPASAAQNWAGYETLIRSALAANPRALEQIFRVTGVPRDSADPDATTEATLGLLRYNVIGTNDLLQVAGGNPYDNRNRNYAGSDNDAALNQGVERVAADPSARTYLTQFYQPTGRLQRPLVTLHTRRDPVVPFEHALLYARAVDQAGAHSQFVGLVVDRYGHCNFETGEVLGALAILVDRADIPLSAALRAYRSAIEAQLRNR